MVQTFPILALGSGSRQRSLGTKEEKIGYLKYKQSYILLFLFFTLRDKRMNLQSNARYCEEVLVSLLFFCSRRDGCELSLLVLFTVVNSSRDSFSLMRSKHRVPPTLTRYLEDTNCFSKIYIYMLANPQNFILFLQALNQPLSLKKYYLFYCTSYQMNR